MSSGVYFWGDASMVSACSPDVLAACWSWSGRHGGLRETLFIQLTRMAGSRSPK